ncbi:MAG: TM1802 family CRISPR-associated protein [Bacillota bacterium]|jgi:CRISPR-associated protein Csh1
MAFLQAVYSLGVMANRKYAESPLASIINFLQLPYSLQEPEDKRTYVIRIWLDVAQPAGEIVRINGVSKIDRIEYQTISDDEEKIRERCLYREPAGKNVQWQFSPLYKLGKGNANAKTALLGTGWQTDKNCRFYKIRHRVLNDYERTGCFSHGSVDRIMNGLLAHINQIAAYWSDQKCSYLLLFGVEQEGTFLYPGEVAAFIKYFRKKLNYDDVQAQDGHYNCPTIKSRCALCGKLSGKVETLDKIFKFATFDKPGFLPGIKNCEGVRKKVYPVCPQCYAILSAGKNIIDNKFVSVHIIPGINLYVIPEIVAFHQTNYQTSELTEEFLESGIKNERLLFENLARRGVGLNFHFLFTETNRAQVIVHYLVEDVSSCRLRELQEIWKETCAAFQKNVENEHEDRCSLDNVFGLIVVMLFSLSGKGEQDKTVMREKALAVICALLNNNRVDVVEIKRLMVTRFAGLFTDPDWMRPKEKGKMPGKIKLKGMMEVVDFLMRVNRRRKDESGLVS